MPRTLKQLFEDRELNRLLPNKFIPDFKVGDTLSVKVKIVEGETTRLQRFDGIVIARQKKSVNSSFTLLRAANKEHIIRKFMLYAPVISSIEVIRYAKVRRAKLYYLQHSIRTIRLKEEISPKRKIRNSTAANS